MVLSWEDLLFVKVQTILIIEAIIIYGDQCLKQMLKSTQNAIKVFHDLRDFIKTMFSFFFLSSLHMCIVF